MPHSILYSLGCEYCDRNGTVDLGGNDNIDTEMGSSETTGVAAAKTATGLNSAVDAPGSFDKASPHAVTLIDSSAGSEEAQVVMPWWKIAVKKVCACV